MLESMPQMLLTSSFLRGSCTYSGCESVSLCYRGAPPCIFPWSWRFDAGRIHTVHQQVCHQTPANFGCCILGAAFTADCLIGCKSLFLFF